MKITVFLSFVGGCIIGVCLAVTFLIPAPQHCNYRPGTDMLFILETVSNDTSLQHMILDPAYRCRIKQAERELK